jgi:hypothetical protein
MAKVKELQQLVGPDAPVYLRISLHRGGSYSYPNEYKQNYSKVKIEGGEGWEKKEDDRFIANKSGRKDITFSGQAVTPGGVGLKEIKLKFDFQPGLRTDFQAGVPTQYMESFSLDDREQQMEFSGDPQDLRIKVIGVAVSPVHTVYFGSEEKFDLYRKSISKAMKKFGKNITPDVAREKEWKITYRNGFREETLPEAKFLGVSDNGSLIFSSKYAYIPLASPPGTTLIHLREPVAIEIDPRNISSIRR